MKTRLVLATRNVGKIKEIKCLLRGLRVRVMTCHDFPAWKDVVENGKTLRENAVKKAKSMARQTGLPALADDSGLFVRALRGNPGVRSARFAGTHCSYDDNNHKLLKMMQGVPRQERQAVFSTVIAVALPNGKVSTVHGTLRGWISFEARGKQGFGYDPVFEVPAYHKTLAELGFDVKNRISHRSLALKRIKKVLAKIKF